MAEAPQQQQQQQEEEQPPTAVGATEPDEVSEEPKEDVQPTPTRPLLSMRSMSSVDPDDDSPNMIVYRKVREKTNSRFFIRLKVFLGMNLLSLMILLRFCEITAGA